MKLNSHIKQGIILFPIIYYLSDLKTALIFITSFIFIDLDHYLLYICRRKEATIKEMFKYFDDIWENRENIYEICIFHTVEFFLSLFILGYFYREAWIILAGFFVHLVFDVYHLYKHNVVFTRAFSIVEYFIRKRFFDKKFHSAKIFREHRDMI